MEIGVNPFLQPENDTLTKSNFIGHFFQKMPVEIQPENIHHGFTEWMVLYFFGVLFFLVLIWYFFPERLLKIIYDENSKKVKKISKSQFTNPGFYLYFLVFLTFVSSTAIVSYFIIKHFTGETLIKKYSTQQLLAMITAAIFIYYFVRLTIILWIGIIFKSMQQNKKLLMAFIRADMLQGIILIPVNFLIYFSFETISTYIAIAVLIAIIVYKWYKIFFIGMSFSNVSVFHNILYLCSLEIIPVFTLLKLLEFYQTAGI